MRYLSGRNQPHRPDCTGEGPSSSTVSMIQTLQVQQRAVKRHKNLRLLTRDMDRDKFRDKPLVIASKACPRSHIYFFLN